MPADRTASMSTLPGGVSNATTDILYTQQLLTQYETSNAASEVNKTLEEVDDEIDKLGGKLEAKVDSLPHEVASGGEE
jgi:hypothetical protein